MVTISKKHKYRSEAELCDEFMQYAHDHKWGVYPETSGWDVLLVKDEVQVGVEAKLTGNVKLLYQATEGVRIGYKAPRKGPNYRAVLIPLKNKIFRVMAHRMGLFCYYPKFNYCPDSYMYLGQRLRFPEAYDWKPKDTVWTPDFEPVMEAGKKSPKVITPWKIKACRVSQVLKSRGFITTQDTKELGINIRTWIDRWVVRTSERDGRHTIYRIKEGAELPHEMWPECIAPED